MTFASGLAASYAVSRLPYTSIAVHLIAAFVQALVYFNPKRVAITGGYHGCHATIEVFKRSRNGDLPIIGIDDEFQPGDLCWLETPLNPTGEARYVIFDL